MATIETHYQGGLRTEAKHLKSNIQLITDAPTDNQGKGESFSPTDLVATGLTSCMMTLMGIAANNHGFEVKQLSAKTTKIMQSNPRRISRIEVEFEIETEHLEQKQIEILKKAALTCPVALSLHPDIEQAISFIEK
jgi:uncharacterized OsmC-like protein